MNDNPRQRAKPQCKEDLCRVIHVQGIADLYAAEIKAS
jgi:hypothetical protein